MSTICKILMPGKYGMSMREAIPSLALCNPFIFIIRRGLPYITFDRISWLPIKF